MKAFKAHTVFEFAYVVGGTSGFFEGVSIILDSSGLHDSDAHFVTDHWRKILIDHQEKTAVKVCELFDLPASAAMCAEIIRDLKQDEPVKITKIESQCRELAKRIEAEMAAHVFLYVNRETARFYDKPFEKWDKTRAAYPGAMYDIEEGSKALALQLNTASVFHMMRVLECGLKSVAAALGITLNPHNRNWGGILGQIRDEVASRNKLSDPQWKADKAFCEQAYGSLHAVKDAWRNTTMHIEKVYDADGAEHIYRMVRAFMEQLSTKLKEAP